MKNDRKNRPRDHPNEKDYGNVCFRNGDITIKGDNVTFDAGTTIELGTVLKVEK